MRFLSSWLRLRSELLKLSDLLLVLLLLAMFTRKLLWTIGPVMMIIVYKIGVGMSPNWGLLNGSSIHWFLVNSMTFFLRPQSLNYSHMNQLRCTCSDLRKVSPARRSCLQNERTHQSIKSSSLSWIHSLDLTSSNFRDLQKVNILLYLFLVRKISRLVSSLPSQYIYPIDAEGQSSKKDENKS